MQLQIDYRQWQHQYARFLKTLSDKQVILLYSGGKDSSVTMDLMCAAAGDLGFDFQAHACAFPAGRYPEAEKNRLAAYWQERGVEIIWHDAERTDADLAAAPNPCNPCREARKQVLKQVLTTIVADWRRLVIVASYSLWDIVSYCVERLLTEVFTVPGTAPAGEAKGRFQETAQRFYPLLDMKEGYTVFRPLIQYNNAAIMAYITQTRLPTLSRACRFSDFRPKRILQRYYETRGLNFDYARVLHFAQTALELPDAADYAGLAKEKYLREIF